MDDVALVLGMGSKGEQHRVTVGGLKFVCRAPYFPSLHNPYTTIDIEYKRILKALQEPQICPCLSIGPKQSRLLSPRRIDEARGIQVRFRKSGSFYFMEEQAIP